MLLEEGKRYVTREGSVTNKLTTITTRQGAHFEGNVQGIELAWCLDGSNSLNERYDLIEELRPPEPPSLSQEKKVANATQHGGTHYKKMAIQPWDYIVSNNLGYLEGNAVKYLSRWRRKNGVEDLRKAIHYIEKLIELEEKNA